MSLSCSSVRANHAAVCRFISNAEMWIERASPLLALSAIVAFSVWAWFGSRATSFQFDELLEIAAAQASSAHQVMASLSAGVDYNPPLSHLLIRATSAGAPTELRARLPAFVGTLCLLGCLYSVVWRWLGRGYALLGVLIGISLPIRDFAIEARPYGIVLGLSALACVFYLRAVEGGDGPLAGLALCSAALVASHYYALLVPAVLVLTELFRTGLPRRRWQIVACCIVPVAVVFWLLHDSISRQRAQLTHYFARGTLLSFDHGYDLLNVDPLVLCIALLAASVVLYFISTERPPNKSAVPARSPELLLGANLLAVPVGGAILTQFVTHAYVARYFAFVAIGFVLCLCYLLRLVAPVILGLRLCLTIALALGFGKALMQEAHRTREVVPAEALDSVAGAPILFDTPADYMAVAHYRPTLQEKIWVIADPGASLRYRKYDTDDKIMIALEKVGQARTVRLGEAVRRWRHFSLIPRPGDSTWALKCLMTTSASIAENTHWILQFHFRHYQ